MKRVLVLVMLLVLAFMPVRAAAGTLVARHAPPPQGRANIARLKLMNYYPSNNGWIYMWTRWQPEKIDADFARIAGLHANAVRLFIFPSTFGFPEPSATMQARLQQAIEMAQIHGLRVQLTLFDWEHPYRQITASKHWADAILRPYQGDPRIAFVELQNEIDPKNPGAMRWARALLPWVRHVTAGIPLTVSVKRFADLAPLKARLGKAQPDFYDLHYYGAPELAYATFAAARDLVSPRPLFIGETGRSESAPAGGACTTAGTQAREALQDQYLRTVEYATRAAGLPAAAVWTLNDFSPSAIPSHAHHLGTAELHYGLYRLDGSARPAAASIQRLFGHGQVDGSFNGGFEQIDGGLPTTWQLYHACQGHFAADGQVAHSGHFSGRISQSTGDSAGWPSFYTAPVTYAFQPGKHYMVSAYARGSHLTGKTEVAISWFDVNGHYLGDVSSPDLPTGTTGWQRLRAEGTAPDGTAAILIYLSSSYNSGAAWFDDVQFSVRQAG